MAQPRYPIDGRKGKAWKITSPFGWRIHPIEKIKKHHNGDDIWGPHPKILIKAWHEGKVIYAGPSRLKKPDGSLGGIGYYVDIRSKINGKWYVTRQGHMEKGSLQVRSGQRVEAGAPLGIMGNTGASAGRHVHFEICEGKTHRWTVDGKGFVSPIKFVETVIKWRKMRASFRELSPENKVSNERPSLDASHLAAKKKPGKKVKLVNPVPGFGGIAKKPTRTKKTK